MEEKRPFRALLVTQFFGAFNDNAWKLFVIVLAERILSAQPQLVGAEREAASQHQTMLAFVVFTIPLLLFSLPAGTLADRLSKRNVIVAMKALETLLMALGALVLWIHPESGFLCLIILGSHGASERAL